MAAPDNCRDVEHLLESEVFMALDLFPSYWQIEIDWCWKELITFVTCSGRY